MTHQDQYTGATPVNYKKGFRIHLLVFLFGIPASWIVWLFTDQTYLWPLWQTAGWTVGILVHYAVYLFKRSNSN